MQKSENQFATKTAILTALILTSTILYPPIASSSHESSTQFVEPQTPTPLTLNVALTGSGATFPAPLVFRWATEYHSLHPNVTVTYQSVGSGRGINELINKTWDFGASDAPLTPEQRILAPNALHIPMTIGSVVAAYNLPGIPTGLNFTGNLLAKIYLEQIPFWDDPQIQSVNPGFILPHHPITTVHRQDGSGTTFVWTSFLCLSSAEWCATVGRGTSVNWPGGVAALGNGGVATYVQNTPYTIGYVELTYALLNAIPFGDVQNPAGKFVRPSLLTTQYAVANSSATLPPGHADWSQVSLLNAPGLDSYPIASFSYALAYRELNVLPTMNLVDKVQANELIKFLKWIVTDGQQFASILSYVPLPQNVRNLDITTINTITFTDISSPVTRNIALSAHATQAWNSTLQGPLITVTSGDTVNLALSSADGLQHRWYIDLDNDQLLDSNEEWNLSPAFTTSTVYSFTPTIWSQNSIPRADDYAYRCSFHPNIAGTIRVQPQQVAAAFKPTSRLSSSLAPTLDSSRVSTIGSLILDMRTLTVSGSINVVAVDKVSGSITSTRSYLIPNLPLSQPDLPLKFIMASPVLPYALSSNVQVELQEGFTASTSKSLTRELDVNTDGIVNIIDVAIAAFAFGTIEGDARYSPLADFDADKKIDIFDIAIIAFHFQAKSLL